MAVPAPVRHRLPRSARLRRSAEFAVARQRGVRVVRGCLVVNWLRQPPGGVTRLGVITSRKVGSAVIRSRARRLLREVFRRHQHEFREPLALVLVARPSIAGRTFGDVERDFLAALRGPALLPA